MALRFQLIHEALGALIIEQADPIGINEMTQTVKRSTDNEGVVYEIIFDIDFIKEGRRYLKKAFEDHGGIDAEVLVNVYEYDPNLRRWRPYANGKVNFSKYDVYEDKLTVNIEQIGFQRRILNLLDTDIDVETLISENGTALPPTLTYEIPYHSKTILKKSLIGPQDSNEAQVLDAFTIHVPNDPAPAEPTAYAIWLAAGHPFSSGRSVIMVGSIDTQKATFEELEETFKVSYAFVELSNGFGPGVMSTPDYVTHLTTYKDGRFEIYKASEAGTLKIVVDINIRHKVEAINDGGDVDICGSGVMGTTEVLYWLEIRDSNDNIISLDNILRDDTPCGGTGSNETDTGYLSDSITLSNVAVEIGQKVYVYNTVRVWGEYERPSGANAGNIVHNLYIQASPPVWDEKTSFNNGDTVIYDGDTWTSDINKNIGFTPGGDNWTPAGPWSGATISTAITLENATTAPVTSAKTLLLYDVFKKCCQYVTNQIDCFKSDLLGRTELGYVVDGDGALIGWTNGGNLRKLPNKKIFSNLKELIDFTDALFCIGFGFEIEAGRNILRVERRSFFYNKNQSVISLGKVYGVKKSLDQKAFYKEIEYGYIGKIDIGKVNAIDEFNTVRRASIPITNTKNKLKISTKVRTSGYQIESQRRLQFSTADSKLDDENFAIVLIRDATIGAGLRTKKDEGYTSIINVYDSATGYNYDISPARCLKNWYEYLASMLIRSTSKLIKFSYGEVNYVMASKKTGETTYLHEDGTFDLTNVVPLFEPFTYKFTGPLNREKFQLLKASPYGVIDFQDQYGKTFEGYVSDKGIDHDSFKATADFELLHVYRKV